MSIAAELFHRLVEKLDARPLWSRHLGNVPECVRQAERRARASFFLFQLPLAAGMALLGGLAAHLGLLGSRPLAGAWLFAISICPLLWPVGAVRAGVIAYRASVSPDTAHSYRLRAFAIVYLLLGALCSAVAVVAFGILVAATLATQRL